MARDRNALSDSEWEKAHSVVAAWKQGPAGVLRCPRCYAEGLRVADQSVRPYSEWYELSCEACELVVTLHLPAARPTGPSD